MSVNQRYDYAYDSFEIVDGATHLHDTKIADEQVLTSYLKMATKNVIAGSFVCRLRMS